MKHRKRFYSPLCLILAAALGSCVGVRADIVMKADGSGAVTLEYRLSKLAESLGKLDGNERWPAVPAGRADFERAAARVPGLNVRSFAAKQEDDRTVMTVVLDFRDPAVLARFLDMSGQRASLTRKEDGAYCLALSLTSGSAGLDPELLSLFTAVTEGYDFSLAFTSPKGGTLSLADTGGAPLADTPDMALVPAGKTVSFRSPVSSLFRLSNGASLTLTWQAAPGTQ
ncbi:MAG: hypothetical protein LBD13_04555 [Spirochaetaceae bacterium]|jgi:hypothetical protein|nr:hypothetical protein [Spirochaetaceae bacterium]